MSASVEHIASAAPSSSSIGTSSGPTLAPSSSSDVPGSRDAAIEQPRRSRAAPLSLSDIASMSTVNAHPERSSTKRTAYLPLLSPSVGEEQSNKRRRVSTPNALGASGGEQAGSYFELRRKSADGQRAANTDVASEQGSSPVSPTSKVSSTPFTTSESLPVSPTSTKDAAPSTTTTGASKDDPNRDSRQRLPIVALPNEIAQSLLKVFESHDPSGSGRQNRAMSVPQTLRRSFDGSARAAILSPRLAGSASLPSTSSASERRESLRAQQLALLASQARLASSGATSMNTALRAEKAVKGAVWKAVEDIQAAKQARSTNATALIASAKGEDKEEIGTDDSSEDEDQKRAEVEGKAGQASVMALADATTSVWSEALADPKAAISFLDSAKEVARGWANGFYKYEQEWVGDALLREQQKINEAAKTSPSEPTSPTKQHESAVDDPSGGEAPAVRRTSLSAPPPSTRTGDVEEGEEGRESLDEVALTLTSAPTSSATVNAAKLTLMAARRRLSAALPLAVAAAHRESVKGERLEIGGSGKLVDVLSNFASLIDSRKEGCHSLEMLAQNARRLSAVQLPQVRFDAAVHESAFAAGGSHAAEKTFASSDEGSPVSNHA